MHVDTISADSQTYGSGGLMPDRLCIRPSAWLPGASSDCEGDAFMHGSALWSHHVHACQACSELVFDRDTLDIHIQYFRSGVRVTEDQLVSSSSFTTFSASLSTVLATIRQYIYATVYLLYPHAARISIASTASAESTARTCPLTA